MKIRLVCPKFPPSLWDFSLCRDIEGSRATHPPLALPTLAALTPREHEVVLEDENVAPVEVDAASDVVGITGYWIQRERVFALADAYRARGRRVAIGGPIVEDSTRDECLAHADHVFQGEAEYTWPRFLADLATRSAARLYVQRELVAMSDSPAPRFELLPRGAYSTATIETSRGCPYTCEFCEIPQRLGQRARTKSVAQVLAEVRALHALGADSIFIIDDHFVGNRAHAREVLGALADFVRSVDHSLYFTCQFTINLARDRELLGLLHAANFRRVFVGIETPRRDGLASVRKTQNLAVDLVDAVHEIQRHNITVWAGMIVGFDTDDAGVFEDQRAFLEAAGIPVVMAGLLQAIPGTPLHARMAREGRLRDLEMSGVRGTYDSLIRSNIVPRGLADEELVRGYQELIRDLYDEEPFGDRLVASIRRGSLPIARGPSKVSARTLAILGRLARWYLIGPARRRRLFRRVVGETLRHRPADLETALMHLVVYKHLREFYGRVAALPTTSRATDVASTSAARRTSAMSSSSRRGGTWRKTAGTLPSVQ